MQQDYFSLARLTATISVFIFILSGCINDDDEFATAQVIEDGDDTMEVTLSGSVGDGPVVNGNIVLSNNSGTIITSKASDDSARYEIIVHVLAGEFPLIAAVDDGADLVTGTAPDFPLMAAVPTSAEGRVVNLNPMSTLIVKLSQRMDGGITAENLSSANQTVRTVLNFGLDTALFPNAMTTDVNDDNVANVIRSSEAFGEMIRRTRDALISNGVTSAEQVLDALSADLIDGVLDGRGAPDVDPRITAVSNIVSAQVTLETMANRLKVGGVEATTRLDDAIRQVTPNNPVVNLTGSIDVSADLLTQASVLLDAAIQFDSDAILLGLRQAMELVVPGQSPQDLPPLLQDGLSDALGAKVQQVSIASVDEITVLNDAVREGFDAIDNGENLAPTIDGNPAAEIFVGSLFEFMPAAGDPNNDPLTFSISGRPTWASFDSGTGRLSGEPGEGDVGSYPGIRITVADGSASTTLPAFTITVMVNEPAGRAPSISGNAGGLVFAGSAYSFKPTASDPDNDVLTFWISGKPSWASFNPETGLLSGTPDAGDVGTYSGIRISVSDDSGASATLPVFVITVAIEGPVNRAPTISGSGAAQVNAGSPYSFTPTASDPDNDPLTFRISGKPSWASFNTGSGRLAGTPGDGAAGSYSGIWITVSDNSGASTTLPAFTITVGERPNRAPSISGSGAAQVNSGSPYSFTPTASDPDNNTLTFSITGKPSWASFSSSTGRLSGTPSLAGTWSGIRIGVSDGSASASLPTFAITVNALPNRAPSISGAPASTVMVGSGYSFTPAASDPDDDVLTFSISGKPSWANFNSGTGRLSGTPGSAGTWSGIRISVSDGKDSASLPAFAITANGLPNRAPSISGSPAFEVMVDSGYGFTPTASDADGDSLTFSISGKPTWANFNSATGRLSGTPGAGDVGTYSGIRISVSDGEAGASLAAFSIEVVAQALGSASLSWVAPTQNEDGSELTDLAGFKVYYGTAIDSMDSVETISNPSVTTYLVENLHAGTWFFKVLAFDTSGNESLDSEIGSKLLQP